MPVRLSTLAAASVLVLATGAQGIGFGRAPSTAVLGSALDFAVPMRLEPDESISTACISAMGVSMLASIAFSQASRSQSRTSPGGGRRDRRGAPGDVVGAAQHLDRNDAQLFVACGHRRYR